MKHLKLIQILFLPVLFLFSSAILADSPKKSNGSNDDRYITNLITKLADDIYCTGELSGVDIKSFYKQEKITAKKITEYYNSHPKSKAFTVKINNLTPLMLAARMGYPDVLEALLKVNSVKENINEQDRSGFTALDYAYYAPKLSGPFYNQGMIDNGLALVPYFVTLGCYAKYSDNNPYIKSIKVLQDNNAEGDVVTFRNKIFKLMPQCPDQIKERIMNSSNLIKTYVEIVNDPKIGIKSMLSTNDNNISSNKLKDSAEEIPSSSVKISIKELLGNYLKAMDPKGKIPELKTIIVSKEEKSRQTKAFIKFFDMTKLSIPAYIRIQRGTKDWSYYPHSNKVYEDDNKIPVIPINVLYTSSIILSESNFKKGQLVLSDKLYRIGNTECYKIDNKAISQIELDATCYVYINAKNYHVVEIYEQHKQNLICKESNFVYLSINDINLVQEYTFEFVMYNKPVQNFKFTFKYEFNPDS